MRCSWGRRTSVSIPTSSPAMCLCSRPPSGADRLEQAAGEYAGPFLDGFHVSDAPEFERWLEEERAELARDYCAVLEQLARRAVDRAPTAEGESSGGGGSAPRTRSTRGSRSGSWKRSWLRVTGHPPSSMSGSTRRWSWKSWTPRLIARCWRWASDSGPQDGDAIERPAAAPKAESMAVPSHPEARPAVVGGPSLPRTQRGADRGRADALTGVWLAGGCPYLWLLAGALLIGLGVGALILGRERAPDIRLGRVGRVTAQPGLEVHPALSPDGKLIAFAAGPADTCGSTSAHLSGGRTIAVTDGTLGDEHWPRWAPDGARLAIEAGDAIYVVPPLGGVAKPLLTKPPRRARAIWPGRPTARKLAYAVGNAIEVVATRRRGGDEDPDSGSAPLAGLVPRRLPAGLRARQRRLRLCEQRDRATSRRARSGSSRPPAADRTRLTDAAGLNTSPVWMPDGKGSSSSRIGTEAETSTAWRWVMPAGRRAK